MINSVFSCTIIAAILSLLPYICFLFPMWRPPFPEVKVPHPPARLPEDSTLRPEFAVMSGSRCRAPRVEKVRVRMSRQTIV
jgi:hypothetical protein